MSVRDGTSPWSRGPQRMSHHHSLPPDPPGPGARPPARQSNPYVPRSVVKYII